MKLTPDITLDSLLCHFLRWKSWPNVLFYGYWFTKCHPLEMSMKYYVDKVTSWGSIATPGNTKGGRITVPLTSCLTGLDESVLQMKTKILSSHAHDSEPVKQGVKRTVILPPLEIPGHTDPIKILFKREIIIKHNCLA